MMRRFFAPKSIAGAEVAFTPSSMRLFRAGLVAVSTSLLMTGLGALLSQNIEDQLAARGLQSSSNIDLFELFFFEGALNPPALTAIYALLALAFTAPFIDLALLYALDPTMASVSRALKAAKRNYLHGVIRALHPAGAFILLALGLGALPLLAALLLETHPNDETRLLIVGCASIPALLSLALYPVAVDRARIELVERPNRASWLSVREILCFAPVHYLMLALRLGLLVHSSGAHGELFVLSALGATLRISELEAHRRVAQSCLRRQHDGHTP